MRQEAAIIIPSNSRHDPVLARTVITSFPQENNEQSKDFRGQQTTGEQSEG